MSRIQEIIESYQPLSYSSVDIIESNVDFKDYSKGEHIFSEGKTNHMEYFILNGICRTYVLNTKGDEITLNFYKEKEILAPYLTRTLNSIALYNFQALTDVTIAQIPATVFEDLMVKHLDIRFFGNQVLLRELINKTEKEIGLASLAAKDRLRKLRKQYPSIENHVPHPVIASYLGITNISLGRLRSDKSL